MKFQIAAFLLMVALLGLGERLAERFLPLYLIALGGGTFAIGLLNGMNNLLAALYSFPGGWLSDKIGYKRALAVFNLVSVAGYLIVVFLPYWPMVILGSMLFLSWTALSLPASMDLISGVMPEKHRTLGVTMHSLVRRFPMALGPVAGGFLIGIYGLESGIRIAFAAASVLALMSLVFQERFIDSPPKKSKAPAGIRESIGLLKGDLRELLISDILIRFCEQIPYAFVVVWCVKMNGISELQFGTLTAIEMTVAVLIYLPVAYFADKCGKKPFVVVTFCFFTLFPLLLLFSHSYEMLLLTFILRGLKEFGEPTRKALILDLAPGDSKASAFGAYYLVRDVFVSIAAFGGALLWDPAPLLAFFRMTGLEFMNFLPQYICSPETNLISAFIAGLLGTLYMALYGKSVKTVSS